MKQFVVRMEISDICPYVVQNSSIICQLDRSNDYMEGGLVQKITNSFLIARIRFKKFQKFHYFRCKSGGLVIQWPDAFANLRTRLKKNILFRLFSTGACTNWRTRYKRDGFVSIFSQKKSSIWRSPSAIWRRRHIMDEHVTKLNGIVSRTRPKMNVCVKKCTAASKKLYFPSWKM